eukprot:g27426.t1
MMDEATADVILLFFSQEVGSKLGLLMQDMLLDTFPETVHLDSGRLQAQVPPRRQGADTHVILLCLCAGLAIPVTGLAAARGWNVPKIVSAMFEIRKVRCDDCQEGRGNAVEEIQIELSARIRRLEMSGLSSAPARCLTNSPQRLQDREMRYREQLAQGRDELLDHSREYSKLQGNLRRSLEDLSILREDLEIAMDEMKRFERHCEDGERGERRWEDLLGSALHLLRELWPSWQDDADRDYSTFVAVTSDRKELERKLAELKDRGHHLDVETKMLRTRAQQVRERVNVPWSERAELTLEQKLEDAAQRLQVAQEELQQQEQHVGSGRYPLTLKTRKQEPDFASRAADAQRMLRIQRDPRFLELQEALNAQTAEVQKPEKKSFMGTRETKESWKQQLSDGLRKLIQTVNMSLDPSMAEKQLENVYRWYVASRPGFSGAPCQAGDAPSPGRPAEMGFYNFCADEVLRHPAPPGSAYFTKEDHEGDLMTSQSVERVEDFEGGGLGRPMAEARLASPKERLKDFSTRAIVRPLTARKLKDKGQRDLAGERPEEPNRPLTPSTTEGGFTARSLVSARSTAVAGVSRPTSAMSMAQSAVSRGATPTPRSVARRPQSAASVDSVPPLPQTVEENTNPAPEEYTLPYPGTEAEWNMERRWMLRRNRAITDKVMGQERNSALRAWAERRARVEEEISRTAEATRFQCALKDRRYIEPPDAEEDIEATVTCEDTMFRVPDNHCENHLE